MGRSNSQDTNRIQGKRKKSSRGPVGPKKVGEATLLTLEHY